MGFSKGWLPSCFLTFAVVFEGQPQLRVYQRNAMNCKVALLCPSTQNSAVLSTELACRALVHQLVPKLTGLLQKVEPTYLPQKNARKRSWLNWSSPCITATDIAYLECIKLSHTLSPCFSDVPVSRAQVLQSGCVQQGASVNRIPLQHTDVSRKAVMEMNSVGIVEKTRVSH